MTILTYQGFVTADEPIEFYRGDVYFHFTHDFGLDVAEAQFVVEDADTDLAVLAYTLEEDADRWTFDTANQGSLFIRYADVMELLPEGAYRYGLMLTGADGRKTPPRVGLFVLRDEVVNPTGLPNIPLDYDSRAELYAAITNLAAMADMGQLSAAAADTDTEITCTLALAEDDVIRIQLATAGTVHEATVTAVTDGVATIDPALTDDAPLYAWVWRIA